MTGREYQPKPVTFNQWLNQLGDIPERSDKDFRESLLRKLYPGTLRDFMDRTTIPRPILNKKLGNDFEKIKQYSEDNVVLAQKLADENEDEYSNRIRVRKDIYNALKRRMLRGEL